MAMVNNQRWSVLANGALRGGGEHLLILLQRDAVPTAEVLILACSVWNLAVRHWVAPQPPRQRHPKEERVEAAGEGEGEDIWMRRGRGCQPNQR